jgi:hypothetical protein
VLLLTTTACMASPQQAQMNRLFDQLVEARTALVQQSTDPACDSVSDVDTRLTGEPGLVDVAPAWTHLRSAAIALRAACGQLRLLQQPFEATASMTEARQRWQAGVSRELSTACEHLTEAARALNSKAAC